MAKYYGIGGLRKGSVGNETYAYNKGTYVVKAKIIKINDAKSKSQVIQRVKFKNTLKSALNIGTNLLNGCFPNTKLSDINSYVSYNCTNAYIPPKQFTDDNNIIGFGNWQNSNGELFINLSLSFVANGIFAWDINDTDFSSATTVGQVSTQILNNSEYSEGDCLNMFFVENVGVTYSSTNLLNVSGDHYIKLVKKNFILNKSDTSTLASKGFSTNGRSALQLEPLTNANNIAYCGAVVSRKSNGILSVSSGIIKGNIAYRSVVLFLANDFAGDQKYLKTYDFNNDPEISDDGLI